MICKLKKKHNDYSPEPAPSYSQKDGEIPELLGQADVSGLRS